MRHDKGQTYGMLAVMSISFAVLGGASLLIHLVPSPSETENTERVKILAKYVGHQYENGVPGKRGAFDKKNGGRVWIEENLRIDISRQFKAGRWYYVWYDAVRVGGEVKRRIIKGAVPRGKLPPKIEFKKDDEPANPLDPKALSEPRGEG